MKIFRLSRKIASLLIAVMLIATLTNFDSLFLNNKMFAAGGTPTQYVLGDGEFQNGTIDKTEDLKVENGKLTLKVGTSGMPKEIVGLSNTIWVPDELNDKVTTLNLDNNTSSSYTPGIKSTTVDVSESYFMRLKENLIISNGSKGVNNIKYDKYVDHSIKKSKDWKGKVPLSITTAIKLSPFNTVHDASGNGFVVNSTKGTIHKSGAASDINLKSGASLIGKEKLFYEIDFQSKFKTNRASAVSYYNTVIGTKPSGYTGIKYAQIEQIDNPRDYEAKIDTKYEGQIPMTIVGTSDAYIPAGPFDTPDTQDFKALAIDNIGNLYLSDNKSGQFYYVNQSGTVINEGTISDGAGGLLTAKVGIVDKNNIYWAATGTNYLVSYNGSTDTISKYNIGHKVSYLTMDTDDNIYVVSDDTVSPKISRFKPSTSAIKTKTAATAHSCFVVNGVLWTANKNTNTVKTYDIKEFDNINANLVSSKDFAISGGPIGFSLNGSALSKNIKLIIATMNGNIYKMDYGTTTSPLTITDLSSKSFTNIRSLGGSLSSYTNMLVKTVNMPVNKTAKWEYVIDSNNTSQIWDKISADPSSIYDKVKGSIQIGVSVSNDSLSWTNINSLNVNTTSSIPLTGTGRYLKLIATMSTTSNVDFLNGNVYLSTITVDSSVAPTPTATPIPTETPIPTATPTPAVANNIVMVYNYNTQTDRSFWDKVTWVTNDQSNTIIEVRLINAPSDTNAFVQVTSGYAFSYTKKKIFQLRVTLKPNGLGVYPSLSSINVIQKISVVGVRLDKNAIVSYVGKKYSLISEIFPSDASIKKLTWSSNDTNVASVDSLGKVTLNNPGKAVITVRTDDGGFVDVCDVTVYSNVFDVS